MKKETIYHILKLSFVAFLFIGFIGCSEDDEPELLFDQTPTERENAKIDELRTLLKSSENGWKFVYFPNESEVGGFTFVFKFIDDQNVQMTSDFDDDTSLFTSKYDVLLGSTVKLSFSTKNDIHKLSDGGNPPDGQLIGRGYFGDFEFLFVGQDGADLVFRANRTFEDEDFEKELRFTPATATDDVDIALNREVINNIRFNSVYSTLEITENGAVKNLTPSFNFDRRILTTTDSATGETESLAFGYTKEGITISTPIEVGGQEFTDLVYNPTTNEFVASGLSGGNTAILKFLNAPVNPTNDNILTTTGFNAFGYFTDFHLGVSSPVFGEVANVLQQNLGQIGFSLSRIQFYFNGAPDPNDTDPNHQNAIEYRLIDIDGVVLQIFHYITYETMSGGIIKLTSTGEWTIPEVIPFVEAMDNILTSPEGLYVKLEDFRIGRIPNGLISYTSVASPNFQMIAFTFQ